MFIINVLYYHLHNRSCLLQQDAGSDNDLTSVLQIAFKLAHCIYRLSAFAFHKKLELY